MTIIYQKAVDEGGVENLVDRSKSTPNLKNRVSAEIEKEVIAIAVDNPAWGQVRVSNQLRKKAMSISPGGVKCRRT